MAPLFASVANKFKVHKSVVFITTSPLSPANNTIQKHKTIQIPPFIRQIHKLKPQYISIVSWDSVSPDREREKKHGEHVVS